MVVDLGQALMLYRCSPATGVDPISVESTLVPLPKAQPEVCITVCSVTKYFCKVNMLGIVCSWETPLCVFATSHALSLLFEGAASGRRIASTALILFPRQCDILLSFDVTNASVVVLCSAFICLST